MQRSADAPPGHAGGGRGLYALVNNAGIGSASPLMETPPEAFASMMAVK
jgi:NAD(P)-dependent dehydrogenase (short-subunit alcohol dehydrogenase family)